MSERTDAFKAHFPKSYGRSYSPVIPDYSRCAASVSSGSHWGSTQCARKNGHGPDGAWCKQHDPEAAKARRDASYAKWKAEAEVKARQHDFQRRCKEAVRAIAAGHNDPRKLCAEIIAELEGKP